MKTDKFGIPLYSENDFIEILYQGKLNILDKISVDFEVEKFNQSSDHLGGIKLRKYSDMDIGIEEFDRILQSDWMMPDEYKNMDIEGYLVNVCPKENYQRLIEEIQEYRSRDMLNLLRWLKYFVDTCRKNGIVWGVGRGSSVASYVLFLIGVHKIDSIRYNLDWQEFLR